MKEIKTALIVTFLYFIFTGAVFPLSIMVITQVLFHEQANGSMVLDRTGKIVGSTLIGQPFSDPKYFHPRPSSAGAGYDASSSSGSNWGPLNAKLVTAVKDEAASYRSRNGLDPSTALPPDAVTRSASGLDPHISPLTQSYKQKEWRVHEGWMLG